MGGKLFFLLEIACVLCANFAQNVEGRLASNSAKIACRPG
jgi:hypothetical protein